MRRINLSITLFSVLVILSLLGFTVYASLNVGFTISNSIMFTAHGVHYKATANVYLLNEDELTTYENDFDALMEDKDPITETFISDNSINQTDKKEWVIPEGDLRFKSDKRYLIYIIVVENHSNFDINVDIVLPTTHSNPNFNDIIENTPSEPINLSALEGPNVSSGTVFLISKCKKIHNSFALENSFDVKLEQIN